MFVGGLSSNVYVVNRLEAIFTHTTHPRLGYPVLIATPRQNQYVHHLSYIMSGGGF